MRIGITSIQRDRDPWIVEWLAFHLLVGFNEFHVYAHKCQDGMDRTLLALARHYPIHVYALHHDDKPQLDAYRHAWSQHGREIDWMAFIDGDEFLFPMQSATMAEALQPYNDARLSALAAYWVCYGSSGHVEDPGGLVMEQFSRHSDVDFGPNRHLKSIVRGRQEHEVHFTGSHMFSTSLGTFDERLQPVLGPVLRDPSVLPPRDVFRINHYVTQHWDFFHHTKQGMAAADMQSSYRRPDSWFHEHDRNECDDGVARRFIVRLKLKVRELNAVLER